MFQIIIVLLSSIFHSSLSFSNQQLGLKNVNSFKLSMKSSTYGTDKSIQSLRDGTWFKLICGASNADIPLIRNLCYVYTIAGVDCIDVSADPAVVIAAHEGIHTASRNHFMKDIEIPYIMISVNDDEDPHFRKASFDPIKCPVDCSRPCEKICPASAITSNSLQSKDGVIQEKCYGCGRCVTICPFDFITTNSYTVSSSTIAELFQTGMISAIEIHTRNRHELKFADLWKSIASSIINHAKVIAVSLPNMQTETIPYMSRLKEIMQSERDIWLQYSGVNIWQLDGRPMSGDIGKGATYPTCEFAKSFLEDIQQDSLLSINYLDFTSEKHFIQLAGGTNDYSSTLAKNLRLDQMKGFGGYGFGGFARKQISILLQDLENLHHSAKIEDFPDEFNKCLIIAKQLVETVKCK